MCVCVHEKNYKKTGKKKRKKARQRVYHRVAGVPPMGCKRLSRYNIIRLSKYKIIVKTLSRYNMAPHIVKLVSRYNVAPHIVKTL